MFGRESIERISQGESFLGVVGFSDGGESVSSRLDIPSIFFFS